MQLPRHPPPPSQEMVESGARLVSMLWSDLKGCPATLFRDDHIAIGDLTPDRGKADARFLDPDGKPLFRIRRCKRWSWSFEMRDDDRVVARIRRTTPLRNVYAITLASGLTWHFKMPLYMVHYYALLETGELLWAMVGRRRREWLFLVPGEHASMELLAALSFIHRDAYHHS